MKSLGIYLHLPFCVNKCRYCDFCSMGTADKELIKNYTAELASRVRIFAEQCGGYSVDTVYFGGGTPTLAAAEDLCSVLTAVKEEYNLCGNAEITAECNPATGGAEYFKTLKEAGFNRLSIGLQSAHDRELSFLGRPHNFADFTETFRAAREAEFDNISVDVMYAIPLQTKESYLETLKTLVSLSPEHISAYALKIEEGTELYKMSGISKLPVTDEDGEVEMYHSAVNYLAYYGYNNYEISNFAQTGYESRHNLRYWTGLDYIGFGVSAHSLFGGERFANSCGIDEFLTGRSIICERERLTVTDLMNEYVMLGLRLKRGVDTADFERKFGREMLSVFTEMKRYLEDGFLVRAGERIAFADKAKYVSNSILSDIII